MRRFRIYRNLHRADWTVQHKVLRPSGRREWRKAMSMTAVHTMSAEFTVGDGGRQRARREGRKNVHAFAQVDYFVASDQGRHAWPLDELSYEHVISYSPYDDRGFRSRTVDNIVLAHDCLFHPNGTILANDVYTEKRAA